MPFNLEVKYYNSFWLKQVTSPKIQDAASPTPGNDSFTKVFPGLADNVYSTEGWPNFPETSKTPTIPYSNVWYSDNQSYNSTNGSNWIIEESRIRGGFNNAQIQLGPRAYLKEDSNDVRHRKSSLIYSGIFNSRTNVNETNVFSVGQDITRTIDPHNGTVQLIHALDNNLAIFQENKVSQALIDKDAIYSTEGNQTTALTSKVIGPVTPYVGDYGISRNPESFANFGFRRYFADKDRNSIMRLSRDGLTEISQYGMKDWFRDELVKISEGQLLYTEAIPLVYNVITGLITQGPDDFSGSGALIEAPLGPWFSIGTVNIPDDVLVGSQIQYNPDYSANPDNFITLESFVVGTGTLDTQIIVYRNGDPIPINALGLNPYVRFVYNQKDKIQGGFDTYKDNYIISLQRFSGSKTTDETSDYYNTLAFDESINGWTTFYTYRPDLIFSLKNNLYTTKNGNLYRHYDSSLNRTRHNNFYGVDNDSSIEFVFNLGPSTQKNFKTISYEGSNGWEVDSFISDPTGNIINDRLVETNDTTQGVKSYEEGIYYENGIPYRVGFNRKDNVYVANLVNNSTASAKEINYGSSITGIKGFFATVKMSTDATTDFGGVKELFAASTEFSTI
jgi:hypothetical protein